MIETLYNRETLLEILHYRAASVKFRKVNGDLRVMRCTLDKSLVPSHAVEALTKGKTTSTPNEEIVTVYDLEKDDWRSFRIDSIIEVL